MKIAHIQAQEILDSRGNPTLETTVELESGVKASASVPSGASTGSYEALELRDGDSFRYNGKGVLKAMANVNEKIANHLVGMEAWDQFALDQKMIDLDGSENKQNLGANAILSVSVATCRAAAKASKKPLYQYLANLFENPQDKFIMPVPMINILNGGKHALASVDMQEYMIMPVGANNIQAAVRYGAEVFHQLKTILKHQNQPTTVGDEGGYAPKLTSNEAPLELIIEAIRAAGYQPGKQIALALDPAASEFFQNDKYQLKVSNQILSSDEMVDLYKTWTEKYPIVSIEDGFDEDDWQGFTKLTQAVGNKVQVVGDDLLVTNQKKLQQGIKQQTANAILIKLNQIGTLTETIKTIKLARQNNWQAVISHRSGETEDTFIADLAVGSGVGQIKTGSMSRSERLAKYNRLMKIERELKEKAQFFKFPFSQ